MLTLTPSTPRSTSATASSFVVGLPQLPAARGGRSSWAPHTRRVPLAFSQPCRCTTRSPNAQS